MILADKFVWFHVPKTGGTWFRTMIYKYAPIREWRAFVFEKHWFAEDMLARHPQYAAKPRWFFVRNPWDWHVSLFFFWHGHYWARTGGFSLPRERWIQSEQTWARRLEEIGKGCGRDGFRKALAQAVDDEDPFATQSGILKHVVAPGEENPPPLHAGRFESLREDSIRMLRESGCVVDGMLLHVLQKHGPLQVSKHGPYRDYYDDETRRLVEKLEAPVIERYGYRF